uniref:EB domain-containing protein n=1 Tax=Alexandrium andersonii TaxID=327968 RepID=A0A7S2MCZ0_9DINO|mmetsp:Transcript_65846/g.147743  ORF Transcript_65846/g.147743 Transcript_65846/m.147743 type:complete len:212 (+) Transcript_65846:77-712(+)
MALQTAAPQKVLLAACIALGLARPSLAFGKCSAGPVGTCAIFSCLPTRGPTSCVGNQCMCMDGYCEAGAALKECRAQVGTCNILPCNWNHGGVLATECINGACLCHTGYHNDGNGVCVRGWWPATELAAMNETQRLAVLPYNEPSDEDAPEKYAKALAEHVPLLAAALLASGFAWAVVTRVRRAAAVLGPQGDALYEHLSGADSEAARVAA